MRGSQERSSSGRNADDADVPDDAGRQDGCDVVRDVVAGVAELSGDAGVVNQHVQVPVGPLDDLRGVADGLIRGHFHLEEGRADGVRGGLSDLRVAGGEIDAVARPGQPPHRFQADALVGTGDQRDESTRGRRVRFLLCFSHTSSLMRDRRDRVAQSVPPCRPNARTGGPLTCQVSGLPDRLQVRLDVFGLPGCRVPVPRARERVQHAHGAPSSP
jgi:hypothetical protein